MSNCHRPKRGNKGLKSDPKTPPKIGSRLTTLGGEFDVKFIILLGIRETDNIVESLGVEKSKEMIKKADLVLLVIDGSKELDQEDQKLLELTEDTNRIIIINKADLGKKVDLEGIEISAKEQDILALTKEIKKKFNLGLISNQEEYYLTNARQTQLLEKAAVSLQSAIDAMKMSIPADLIVEDLYDSWSCLKEILGEQAKEDLLDELFKRFCIGK